MKKILFIFIMTWLALIALYATPQKNTRIPKSTQTSDDYKLTIEEWYSGLNHPWGIAWYPLGSGEYATLITERNGSVWVFYNDLIKEIIGLPNDVLQSGQGGWFDILVNKNAQVFLSYAKGNRSANATAVLRFSLDAADISANGSNTVTAQALEQVFRMNKEESGTYHFGGMMSFDEASQTLYIGFGERNNRYEAQNSKSHNGTVIAIDCSSASSNSNSKTASRYPSKILTWGHRNPQGLFFDSTRNILYENEHGPYGGDEINIIEQGKNYGWPVISWGKEYGSKKQVGEGTHKAGLEQPLHYWPVSPALSGLLVYDGSTFAKWQGHIISGSLKNNQLYLVRLNKAGNRVLNVEELFRSKFGRIRAIEQAPDGYIYFITDENNGKMYKMSPK